VLGLRLPSVVDQAEYRFLFRSERNGTQDTNENSLPAQALGTIAMPFPD
jgi:hypothetical protein